jgi:hypothetical protein
MAGKSPAASQTCHGLAAAKLVEVPPMSLPTLRTAALAAAASLLAGCVPPPQPPQQFAPLVVQPDDACGQEAVAFSVMARYFDQPDPLPPEPATFMVELQSENNALERLEMAFGILVRCRWMEARKTPDALARLRQETAQAAMLRDVAEARGERLEAPVTRESPDARAAIAAAAATPATPLRAVSGMAVELRLRPEPDSPIMAWLPPRVRSTLQPGPGQFARVDAGHGARGYAPAAAFIPVPEVQVTGDGSGFVSLAATAAARRAAFRDAIAQAEGPPPF